MECNVVEGFFYRQVALLDCFAYSTSPTSAFESLRVLSVTSGVVVLTSSVDYMDDITRDEEATSTKKAYIASSDRLVTTIPSL